MAVTGDLLNSEFQAGTMPGAQERYGRLAAYLAERLVSESIGERLRDFASTHPTLVVWGAEDRILPPSIGDKAAVIGGVAKPHVVEEAGHAVPFEKPGIFNHLLSHFLRGNASGVREGGYRKMLDSVG